jgi:hypothetical protein
LKVGFVLLAGHAPAWALAGAAALVVLRIVVIVLGPGALFAAAGAALQKTWTRKLLQPSVAGERTPNLDRPRAPT